MKRSRSEVGGYRGRKTLTEILKWIAVLLTILVVLMAAGLLFGQRFLVFSDSGLRLDLPFDWSTSQGEDPEPDGSVVIEPDGSQSQEDPVPPDQSIQEPAEPVFAAVELPLSAITGGTALTDLENAGGNAVILEMKDPEGKLAWVSQQPLALSSGVNPGDEGINEVLRQWNQGDVHTVARVCCFRDNTVPYHNNSVALRATYGNWRDEVGSRWLNPANEGAQSYLAGLCGELAALGFDEIWLDVCSFPTLGEQGSITGGAGYGPGQFEGSLGKFLALAEQAVQPYGTQLSLTVDRADLTGQGALSGRTPANLETYVDRLWMTEDGLTPALSEVLSQAGVTRGEERLIRLVTAFTPQEMAQALCQP